VIVVDNGSTDDTRGVANSFSGSLQVVYAYAAEPGLHVGRHEGLRKAKTDILVYADDDIQAIPTWLETIKNAFADSAVAMVGGNNYPVFQAEPPEWLRQWWNRPVYKGKALGYLSILDFGEGQFDIDPRYIWGCNFSVRREVLLDAGGFHPDGMPAANIKYRGDGETHVSDYVRGKAMRAVFHSGASINHLVPRERMGKEYFRKRAFSQGVSDSYALHRNRAGLPVMRHYLKRHFGGAAAKSIAAAFTSEKFVPAELADFMGLQKELRKSYWEGFDYHQSQLRTDPLLSEWVRKPSYL
jgi:glycosyltransferase involved in cell wall biosynthesis